AELAEAIQEGLAAKAAGDTDTATFKLGRAAQLAAATGNEEASQRLAKVVDIEDAGTGTVRLKRDVAKLDEMALDTSSTNTPRVHPAGRARVQRGTGLPRTTSAMCAARPSSPCPVAWWSRHRRCARVPLRHLHQQRPPSPRPAHPIRARTARPATLPTPCSA